VSAADASWSMALTQELMWDKSSTGEDPEQDKASRPEQLGRGRGSSGDGIHCDGVADGREIPTGLDKGGTSRTSSTGAGGCSSNDGRLLSSSQSSGAYIFRPAASAPVSHLHCLLC